MIIRSKAPLRLGLAGGGSDVSPYSDVYGGSILNATISLYAYCTILEQDENHVTFNAPDIKAYAEYPITKKLAIDGTLDLHKAVYNRIIKDFNVEIPSFMMTTYSDAPPGSGLGSSSTMVVAILTAFSEWLSLPLGEYDIARLAYEIEREDLGLSGGKQDQYAATFGGFNLMEFGDNGKVIVNPLRIKQWIIDELESSIILYYTGASRESANIIDEQKENTKSGNTVAIEAMHRIKESSIEMKNAILLGDIMKFATILGKSWNDKKMMAMSISNSEIENIFEKAIEAGALTGKISGAGGGGFIIFVVNPIRKVTVANALSTLGGRIVDFQFSKGGTHSWKTDKDIR